MFRCDSNTFVDEHVWFTNDDNICDIHASSNDDDDDDDDDDGDDDDGDDGGGHNSNSFNCYQNDSSDSDDDDDGGGNSNNNLQIKGFVCSCRSPKFKVKNIYSDYKETKMCCK